mmetsp:Transcript_32048/g.54284  ORF Transcript_32048/g.54284 Transcript_32048/m.54284 type:complete len:91 (-) Transcript_32048:55-327(-)
MGLICLVDAEYCTAYHCSVGVFLNECKAKYNINEFGIVYLDYCTRLEGGAALISACAGSIFIVAVIIKSIHHHLNCRNNVLFHDNSTATE